MRIEQDLKLDFKDVLIRPKRSTLTSRSEVDISRDFVFLHSQRKYHGIPIIAALRDGFGHTGSNGRGFVHLGRQPGHELHAGLRGIARQGVDGVDVFGEGEQIRVGLLQALFQHGSDHADGLKRARHVVANGRCQPAQQRVACAFSEPGPLG